MTSRPVITLLTDTGKDSFHLARLKGSLLSQLAQSPVLVDIDHQIEHFNILEAAYKLAAAYSNFPANTIHCVDVHSFYESDFEIIVFEQNEHFFVGPNNGVFSLIFDELQSPIYIVPQNRKHDLCDIFTAAICGIVDKSFESWTQTPHFVERLKLAPVVGPKEIRATIIYIDEYENVVTNVTQSRFEEVRKGRQFAIYFKRFDPITYMSAHYGEVEIGETVCRFNSLGFLEIALNLEKAASAFDLKLNDTIQIEFY